MTLKHPVCLPNLVSAIALPGFPGIQACLPSNKRCFAFFLNVLVNRQRLLPETANHNTVEPTASCRGSTQHTGGGSCLVQRQVFPKLCRWLRSSMFRLHKSTHPCVRNSSSRGYYHPYGLNIKKAQHPRNQLLIQT